MRTVEILKSLAQEGRNTAVDLVRRRLGNTLPANLSQLNDEITTNGYALVPDFMSAQECETIRSRMDEIIDTNQKIWKDAQGSDHRIYFANEASEEVNCFLHNRVVTSVISTYEKTNKYSGFTLANKLVFKENNAGSGGGWHRDLVKRKQTKALLYLSDVTEQSGPFQFITGTHQFSNVIKFQKEFGFRYNQSRFADEEIREVISKYPELLFTVTGSLGTLLLVDTRGLHRGKPIEAGTRYALTNYYWFNSAIPAHIRKLDTFL
jgi:hypothetical protein